MRDQYKPRVQFFVSSKADILTSRVNAWLDEMNEKYEDNYFTILNIDSFMSYTSIKDKGAMMIGCMIEYVMLKKEEPYGN